MKYWSFVEKALDKKCKDTRFINCRVGLGVFQVHPGAGFRLNSAHVNKLVTP